MSTAQFVRAILLHIAEMVFLMGLFTAGAKAQETLHPTIADCPAGYMLGIQETTDLQVPTSLNNTPNPDNKSSDQLAREAPRQFVTGCVPNNTQQTGR